MPLIFSKADHIKQKNYKLVLILNTFLLSMLWILLQFSISTLNADNKANPWSFTENEIH